MSSKADVGDLENSLPSWISNHLGEKSYMADEITRLSSSPRKGSPSLEVKPSADVLPPIEKETNTMTQGHLDRLKESYSFPPRLQIRLPEAI